MQAIASNKKANHDYLIMQKYEAGIVLSGSEVKSLRVNSASIKESYIKDRNGELWLANCHIKKYSASIDSNYNPVNERKILLKKREIGKILGSFRKEGISIIPLFLYFNDKGIAKITIGLGKGKKKYDKRQSIKTKEWSIKKQRLQKNR